MKIKSITTKIELTHDELRKALQTVLPSMGENGRIYNFEGGITFEIIEDDVKEQMEEINKAFDTAINKAFGLKELHNPNELNSQVIGIKEGYRLLFKDEIVPTLDGKAGCVFDLLMWDPHNNKWDRNNIGNSDRRTYRTKLTPEELKKARGL